MPLIATDTLVKYFPYSELLLEGTIVADSWVSEYDILRFIEQKFTISENEKHQLPYSISKEDSEEVVSDLLEIKKLANSSHETLCLRNSSPYPQAEIVEMVKDATVNLVFEEYYEQQQQPMVAAVIPMLQRSGSPLHHNPSDDNQLATDKDIQMTI